jgi:RNA polymerase sigma-70 factor, ECF subfamily
MNDIARQLEAHYIELSPMLLAYFRRQRALAGAADDLLQETFLRAWRERTRLCTATSPRAYLFGIARHVSLDALRRVRPTEPLEHEVESEPSVATDERMAQMRVAIESLPETHREPLLLKLQQELSYAEIAQVLGLPVGTVRSRLHYAVERLQLALNPRSETAASNREIPLHSQTHEN